MKYSNRTLKTIFSLSVAFLCAGVFAPSVGAQSEELQDAKNQVLESLEALEGSTSDAGLLKATVATTPEFEARKKAFLKVLEYSYKEAQELLTTKILTQVSSTEPYIAAAAHSYAKAFEGYQQNIRALQTRITDNSIQASEELKQAAIEFKQWRQDNVDAQTHNVLDFDLWIEAEATLSTALLRAAKIEVDVDRLDTEHIVSRTVLAPYLDAANALLTDAEVKHARAAEIVFAQFASLLPSSTLKLAATGRSSSSEPFVQVGKRETAQELLEEVYASVADAYREFLRMRAKLVR